MAEPTITRVELELALQNVPFLAEEGCPLFDRDPYLLSAALFNWIANYREPPYIDGAIYMDARGIVCKFYAAKPGRGDNYPLWNEMGCSREIPFDQPKRPLTRMVAVSS